MTLTKRQRALLEWDEEAPSPIPMTYDEWEAVRSERRDVLLALLEDERQASLGLDAKDPPAR